MIPRPECLLKPINFPKKLLMGPGPSNATPRALAAGSFPLIGHLHPEFIKIMDEVKEGIQYIFQTTNKVTFAVSATGHGAMEAACCNIIEDGDIVLVAVNGVWGERFADIASRHGANVKEIKKMHGEVFNVAEIEKALQQHTPSVMFITHGESSSTILQPLAGVGQLCHRYNCILIVDSVATAGGVPLYMDDWSIDVLYTASQKVISAPPGTSPISFSERAWQKIQNRRSKVKSFYFDVTWLSNYWGCVGQDRKYHHTAPISSIFGLREGIAAIVEEGLESCWKRHQECAQLLYDGLKNMALQLYIKEPVHRLPTLTGVLVPNGINWKKVTDFAMSKYKMEISGSPDPLSGKVWRIGIMGYNARPENVSLVLRVLEEGIQHSREQQS